MKLKEQLRMLVILLAMPLAFVACDNNDDENGAPIVAEKGVFVFNSGNQASGIDGTLTRKRKRYRITCLRRLMNAN